MTPPTSAEWPRLLPAAGRGLVWSEDAEMTYTNWEVHDVAFSVLSPNSCFWIQSNTGLWKPGSCRNRTHGVICKQPRSECAASETYTVRTRAKLLRVYEINSPLFSSQLFKVESSNVSLNTAAIVLPLFLRRA